MLGLHSSHIDPSPRMCNNRIDLLCSQRWKSVCCPSKIGQAPVPDHKVDSINCGQSLKA